MSETTADLSEVLAWKGNKLVVTDEATISRLRRKTLSPSTAKSMQGCAARWVGDKLLSSDEENPFDPAPIGTSAHAVMEDFYDLSPHLRTLAAAEKILLEHAEKQWPEDPKETDAVRIAVRLAKRRWIDDVKTAYEGIFTIEDPREVEVHSREMKLDGVLINGVPTVGFVDRVSWVIDCDGKKQLRVEDYKTSAKMPRLRFGDDHGDQIRTYVAGIGQMLDQTPTQGAVLYTKLGKIRTSEDEKEPIDLSKPAMDKTLKNFKLSWTRHNRYHDSGEFPTKEGPLCGWCPLVNDCPVAEDNGREAKKDGLRSKAELGIPRLRPGAAPEADETGYENHPGLDPAALDPAELHALAMMSETAFSAHMEDVPAALGQPDEINDSNEGDDMSEEPKPWIEYLPNGELNPNSYAATAVHGIGQMAGKYLHDNGQELTEAKVTGLSEIFAKVILKAESAWTDERPSFQSGANTRLRGCVHAALETLPVAPFDGTADDWKDWIRNLAKRTRSFNSVGLNLHLQNYSDTPWDAFTGAAPAADDVFGGNDVDLSKAA